VRATSLRDASPAAPSDLMRTSRRLAPLIQQLPFPIDATERLNDVFRRWVETAARPDRDILDLWTYCFTWRYFLSKAARGGLRRPSDIDALTAQTFRRTCRTRTDMGRIVRYANWVSVVCRNTYINYLQRGRGVVWIDDLDGEFVTEPAPIYDDAPLICGVLQAAIHRLPPYLRETARLYFVEGHGFDAVAQALDLGVPTVRVYKQRSLQRLRDDTELTRTLANYRSGPP